MYLVIYIKYIRICSLYKLSTLLSTNERLGILQFIFDLKCFKYNVANKSQSLGEHLRVLRAGSGMNRGCLCCCHNQLYKNKFAIFTQAFARFARQDHFPETRGVSLVSKKDICFYTSTCRRLSLSAFVDEIAAGYYFELS